MRIAIFISGRITCYERCLIPILEYLSQKHQVDIFISVNSVRDNYHEEAKYRLSRWLKNIRYEEFNVPETFKDNTHPESLRQLVYGKLKPYTVLSCFYNDKIAFGLAEQYAQEKGFEYDIFCKFRADMIFENLYKLDLEKPLPDTIYSCVPPCRIYFEGNTNIQMCVSDALAYGDLNSMRKYTNTYDTILDINNRMDGDYRINYELSLTESIYRMIYYSGYYTKYYKENLLEKYIDKLSYYKLACSADDANRIISESNTKVLFFNAPYTLDNNRRHRDKIKNS